MSIHNYTRTLISGLWWDVRVLELAKEARAALPAIAFKMKATGTDLSAEATPDLSAGEITTLDTVVADHKAAMVSTYLLPIVKKYCSKRIDDKTEELRAAGWEYPTSSGNYYSLTAQAEAKLNSALLRKDDNPFLSTRLATVDNSAIVILDTPAKVEAAHKQMNTAINTLVEGGVDLKILIAAAATIPAALAVADPR